MAYISRAFKKIGENIGRIFRRHEPIQEYSIREPGYVPIVKTARPEVKRHDAGIDLPGFDPKAGRYKHKIGEEGPLVGQRRKPKAEYTPSHLERRRAKKAKKDEEEYIEPTIIELRKEAEKEEGKKKAA